MNPNDIGRRDFFSILMWLVAALVGRWKVPAQLAPAAELVQRVITERHLFKGGELRIGIRIMGWEMPTAWKMTVDKQVLDKVYRDEQFREQFAQSLQVGFKKNEEVVDGSIVAG